MSEPNDEPRAMRAMIRELRAEVPPELPWGRLELRLMAEIDRRERARRARLAATPASPFAHVAGFAMAAAVLALAVGSVAGRTAQETASARPAPVAVDAAASPLAAGEAGAHGARDLATLAVGDLIDSSAPVAFGRDGLVTWTLSAGSRVRVVSMGEGLPRGARAGVGHTVALERGSIHAEVTPRAASEGLVEAFAVEVEGTRVAAHGTAFTVTRADGQVLVDVEHGAVAVGPVGHAGSTTGHLLVGPARATFSLDGGRTAAWLPRPAAPVEVATTGDAVPGGPFTLGGSPAVLSPGLVEPRAAVAPAHGEPGATAARHPGAPVAHPVLAGEPGGSAADPPEAGVTAAPLAPAPPVALTAAAVRARLGRCFKDTYDEAGGASVKLSIASTLRLVLGPDGGVRSARFDPPLKPEFQVCAGGAIAGRFTEGAREVTIPVAFTLP